MAFIIFTQLCKCHDCVIPEHFHHLPQNPQTVSSLFHSSFPPVPGDLNLLSLCIDMPIVDIHINGMEFIWNHINDFIPMLWHISALHSFSWLSDSLLYGYTTVYPFFSWCIFDLFILLAINNAAMNICVQVFIWPLEINFGVEFSWVYYRSGILES